jgi:hypothetical protein
MTIGIGAGLTFGIGQPLQYPFINGFAPSFASIEFKPKILGGASLPTIITMQSIDYDLSNDAKRIFGTNPNQLSVTRGEITNTAKCKMLLWEAANLRGALGAFDPTGNNAYGDVFFDVTVQFSEAGGPIITDQLRACRLYKAGRTSAVGPDAIMEELDLNPMLILLAGQPMSSSALSAPQFP